MEMVLSAFGLYGARRARRARGKREREGEKERVFGGEERDMCKGGAPSSAKRENPHEANPLIGTYGSKMAVISRGVSTMAVGDTWA